MSIARVRLASPALAGQFSLAATGLVDWQIERVERVSTLSVRQPIASNRDVRDRSPVYPRLQADLRKRYARRARLSDGLNFHGDTLLFSWPSGNKLLDYFSDRESPYGHGTRLTKRSRACLPLRLLASPHRRIAWAVC